jgi:hypothetical protein
MLDTVGCATNLNVQPCSPPSQLNPSRTLKIQVVNLDVHPTLSLPPAAHAGLLASIWGQQPPHRDTTAGQQQGQQQGRPQPHNPHQTQQLAGGQRSPQRVSAAGRQPPVGPDLPGGGPGTSGTSGTPHPAGDAGGGGGPSVELELSVGLAGVGLSVVSETEELAYLALRGILAWAQCTTLQVRADRVRSTGLVHFIASGPSFLGWTWPWDLGLGIGPTRPGAVGQPCIPSSTHCFACRSPPPPPARCGNTLRLDNTLPDARPPWTHRTDHPTHPAGATSGASAGVSACCAPQPSARQPPPLSSPQRSVFSVRRRRAPRSAACNNTLPDACSPLHKHTHAFTPPTPLTPPLALSLRPHDGPNASFCPGVGARRAPGLRLDDPHHFNISIQ